ncbi:hypothetical protein DMENIID0001_110530 [Sergentomyia squamirostris]
MFLDDKNATPHALAHQSFITILSYGNCYDVHYYSTELKCSFVRNTQSCAREVMFLDYHPLIYCYGVFSPVAQKIFSTFLMIILLVGFFLLIAMLVDRFFLPVMNLVAYKLGFSESLAGITLISIGSGIPDIFTIFLEDFANNGDTLVSEVLGSVTFCVAVVPACIMILRPFRVVSRQYHRDTIFLIISVSLLIFFLSDRIFSLMEGILLCLIYLTYIFTVAGDHLLQKYRARQNLKGNMPFKKTIDGLLEMEAESVVRRLKEKRQPYESNRRRTSIFNQFLDSITPLNLELFTYSSWLYQRIQEVVQAPLYLISLLTIPIVDHSFPGMKWSKLLNVLHCITFPQLLVFLFEASDYMLFGVPLWMILLVVGLIGSVVVFMTSVVERPPRYHVIYVAMSFIGSMVALHFISEEIDSILFSLGVVLKVTTATLKITVPAWGGAATDLISSLALTKLGYHRTAFAYTYGVPMFYVTFYIPVCFLYEMIRSGQTEIVSKFGHMGVTVSIFLILILVLEMLAITICQNCARKSIGIYMLIIYGIFLFYCFLAEGEIVHDYGTNHEHLHNYINFQQANFHKKLFRKSFRGK